MSVDPKPDWSKSQDVDWSRFNRSIPTWFTDAKLGIFIHWGAYSVPAFGEPIGELGTIDFKTWFKHNPYAEWYFNTIRIEGSPASAYHAEKFNNAPYDDFLDQWRAENFDAEKWAQLFSYAGAQYVVPTSKHHDGIALWDAPGTGNRNTVKRGPKKDLIGAIAAAVKKTGMHFGVYYSGGLDWGISDLPPQTTEEEVRTWRPNDPAYAMYAYQHFKDLIDKYEPEILFNDIEWPESGKREGSYSLIELFDYFYKKIPNGVVNDRWGDHRSGGQTVHSDYRTSEYKSSLDVEDSPAWENCRGIGYSFGYNAVETKEHYIEVPALLRHFIDIVSRGGNFLLNVGPTASGEIPEIQEKVLRGLGDWMKVNSEAIYGTRPIKGLTSSDTSWVRWTSKGNRIFAHIDAIGPVNLLDPNNLLALGEKQAGSAKILGAGKISIIKNGDVLTFEIPNSNVVGPTVIEFTKAT